MWIRMRATVAVQKVDLADLGPGNLVHVPNGIRSFIES